MRMYQPTGDKPKIFPAAAPKTEFLLADGTSTPKPASMTVRTNVTMTITLTSPAKGKTLLDMRTAYVVDVDLRRWVMVSGFSPMAAQRASARFMDEARLVFNSGDIGVLSKRFPENRTYPGCISGAWPIECSSTGAFEKRILNGIIASISQQVENITFFQASSTE